MDANGWRPISEAPKDGREIIGAWIHKNDVKKVAIIYWNRELETQINFPTHWMPLPPPPAQEVKS